MTTKSITGYPIIDDILESIAPSDESLASRAGKRDNWHVVKLGRNTFIERDGESPFICDMQTYDSSNAEQEEARQLAEQIITEHNQRTTLIEQRERLLATLRKLAAFDDAGGNMVLRKQGNYSGFDEPGAVQTARELLATIEPETEVKSNTSGEAGR